MTNIDRPILIADDDPVNRDILTDSIKAILPQADIEYAMNGEQAVERVKARMQSADNNFQIIFMDYQMPLMNGQEATKAIRAFEQAQHVVGTKSAFIVTWSAARKTPYEGADAIIAKPLLENELAAVIKECP